MDQGAYGTLLGNAFGMREPHTLIARTPREFPRFVTAVTEIQCGQDFGRTKPLPRDDAYLVGLHLSACDDHDLYLGGRRIRAAKFFRGATSIYDLQRDPVWDIRDPWHCLMLYLPRRILDEVAGDARASGTGTLRDRPGIGIDDPVVRHLLSSLLPAVTHSEDPPALFVDHVIHALAAHVAQAYCGLRVARMTPRGGLAPWQERRAKDLMTAQLSEEIPLSRLAAECGLSVRHFSRAFRTSTGVPPHRWLLKHRVERAAELLASSAVPLVDIAISCGFADQSHFTRVFTALRGASPNAWRRTKCTGCLRSAPTEQGDLAASITGADALREVAR